MTINKFAKTSFILLFIISSIYFARNVLIDNKVTTGIVVEENLAAFVGKKDITAIIYGKTTCSYCKRAIAELEKNNINYLYKNIKESPQALQEFTALNGRAIPLLITRYMKITGFTEEWFATQVLIENKIPPQIDAG
jgi:glutaredoxin